MSRDLQVWWPKHRNYFHNRDIILFIPYLCKLGSKVVHKLFQYIKLYMSDFIYHNESTFYSLNFTVS